MDTDTRAAIQQMLSDMNNHALWEAIDPYDEYGIGLRDGMTAMLEIAERLDFMLDSPSAT
jgi:hypothetical protein